MKRNSFGTENINSLRNIGPTVCRRLNEIGVYTKADLATIGPVRAYLQIKERYAGKTLPVCYYLYSLQGALLDLHWDDLPEEIKADLRKKVGRE